MANTVNDIKEAIITVIKTTYQYDAPQAFKLVKRIGYEIYKSEGHWVVRNRETWKTVRVNGRGALVLANRRVEKENINKVDIIAYLNTPINRAYWNDTTNFIWTPTQNKMHNLRWAKQRVADCEATMEKLAKEMERARTRYMEATKALIIERAKDGLIKGV